MPGGESLRIGPFTGGLNLSSDPTVVADAELVECINFELDTDSSLVSRPPFREVSGPAGLSNRLIIIGSAVFPSGNYLIGSNEQGCWQFDGSSWTAIVGAPSSYVALQYRDKVWIVGRPGAGNGGSWDPAAGFTAVATMAKGESALIHKERLFVFPGLSATVNTSRMTFSNAGDFTIWTGTDFIDVAPGDGSKLIDGVIFNDNMILFDEDKTFVLEYELKPSDAILKPINTTIGASTRRCVISYENSLFCYHEGNVYEIQNYDFTRINAKVDFVYDPSAPAARAIEVFLCLLGDRLVLRFYNKIYVFGLRTRTWSEWKSESVDLHNFGLWQAFPNANLANADQTYYAGSSIQNNFNIYRFVDTVDDITTEQTLTPTTEWDIICSIRTKNFDLADSHHFKRMFWWGADIHSNREVIASANPIVYNFSVTWDHVELPQWAELGTWGAPLTQPDVASSIVVGGGSLFRRFIKLLKSLRFRQINFTLVLRTNGTTLQGPARIFSLTIIVATKQTVVKQVS